MISAEIRVNGQFLGAIEVQRTQTRPDGNHLYRYGLFQTAVAPTTYGVIAHQESEGAFVLLHKALGECLKDRF